jgi:hypothetical protein
MANILDVIKGLNQAATNAYDGYQHMDSKIGLTREEGHPILDSRQMDGFRVRFAADKMMLTYQAEVLAKQLHPRRQFENEIERKFKDIAKYLQKEYKKITKNSVTLSSDEEADMYVQSTSRVRVWVQAHKQYKIGGLSDADSVRKTSVGDTDKPYEKKFKDFLDLATDKKSQTNK